MGCQPKTWKRLMQILLPAGLNIVFLSGCANTVILVPPRTPIQLAEPTEARVFVVQKDGTKVKSQNKVTLQAGWWVADINE